MSELGWNEPTEALISMSLQAKHHSLPPVSLQGQLLWREFFYTVASATPNFTKMAGNPICLQIRWYEDAERLHKWKTVTRCISTMAAFWFGPSRRADVDFCLRLRRGSHGLMPS